MACGVPRLCFVSILCLSVLLPLFVLVLSALVFSFLVRRQCRLYLCCLHRSAPPGPVSAFLHRPCSYIVLRCFVSLSSAVFFLLHYRFPSVPLALSLFSFRFPGVLRGMSGPHPPARMTNQPPPIVSPHRCGAAGRWNSDSTSLSWAQAQSTHHPNAKTNLPSTPARAAATGSGTAILLAQ